MRPRMIELPESYARLFADARDRLPAGRQLQGFREAGFARLRDLGFPSQRVEEWKYTGIGGLLKREFALAQPTGVGAAEIAPYLAGGDDARRLVFVNGHLVPELSRLDLPRGASLTDLAGLLEDVEDPGPVLADGEAERSFSAFNAAFLTGGAYLRIEDGVALDEPIQLLFVTRGGERASMTHPRNVVEIGDGARLRLIESHVALDEGEVFTNLVARIRVGKGAELIHDRLQIGHPGSSLIGRTELAIGDEGRVEQTLATLGGDLVRNETHAVLASHVVLHLNGTYLPRGREHVDNQIWIEHALPHSESNQFYKGVIDERGHAVFAGKISVRPGAQKTNAFQANNNLLLSEDASVDTKPELEIFADDVKCSHGATVGELDERALFYLRSRGLDPETARGVLTYAFAGEVIERFAHDEIKAQIRRELRRWLPGIEALEDLG